MLTVIPDLLTAAQVTELCGLIDAAPWIDGNDTSGNQSALAKHNAQLPEDSDAARRGGAMVLDALAASPLFVAAALPLKVFPPLFNRYEGGGHFGAHVDTAVRYVNQAPYRVRTDLSATLFLSDPDAYDGGELSIEDTYGTHRVKLPAGDLLLYPASSVHEVRPVTRGARVAAFFWIQSMIRDDGQRTLLFQLDRAIQDLNRDVPGHTSTVALTGTYHNLLRRWAEL